MLVFKGFQTLNLAISGLHGNIGQLHQLLTTATETLEASGELAAV